MPRTRIDLQAAAEKIGASRALTLERVAEIIEADRPRSLNALNRAVSRRTGQDVRTVQRHIDAARRAGLIEWTAKRRTSPVRAHAITIPAAKQGDELGMAGRDEHVAGADAGRDRSAQDASADRRDELAGETVGNIGVQEGHADPLKSRRRVRVSQDAPAAKSANRRRKPFSQVVKHEAEGTAPPPDSPRFNRQGYDTSGAWTRDEIDHVIRHVCGPVRGGLQPVRRAAAGLLDTIRRTRPTVAAPADRAANLHGRAAKSLTSAPITPEHATRLIAAATRKEAGR